MKKNIIFGLIIFLSACGGKKEKNALDLMAYGLPIAIDAPADSEVVVDDMGVWKDVTVKSGDDYFVQILSSDATRTDVTAIVNERKLDVISSPFFSKMVQEDEAGFIYEKKIDENTIDYDFVFIKIQGDREFAYQTGLYGTFSEEQVRNMYKSVQ